MKTTTSPENALMAMIVRRCNLDADATAQLLRVEAAAWDFVADDPSTDLVRHVLAVVGTAATEPAATTTPSARRLLRAHGRARQAGVPADVLVGFTEESLRMALLLHDAFRRGFQLGQAQRPARTPGRRSAGELPH
jgi:hypothetical protein